MKAKTASLGCRAIDEKVYKRVLAATEAKGFKPNGHILLALIPLLMIPSIYAADISENSTIINFYVPATWTADNSYQYPPYTDVGKSTAFIDSPRNKIIPEPNWIYNDDFSGALTGWTQPSGTGGSGCSTSSGRFSCGGNCDCDYRFGGSKNYAQSPIFYQLDYYSSGIIANAKSTGLKTPETGWSPVFETGTQSGTSATNHIYNNGAAGAFTTGLSFQANAWRRFSMSVNSSGVEFIVDNSSSTGNYKYVDDTQYWTNGIKAIYAYNDPWFGDHFRVWNGSNVNNGKRDWVSGLINFSSAFSRVNVDWGTVNGTAGFSFKASNNNGTSWITLSDNVVGSFAATSQNLMLNITVPNNGSFPGGFNVTVSLGVDTTPPGITLLNLTSGGGAGQLVNLTDTQCQNPGCTVPSTSDTTPTFEVVTDENAYCRIGVSNANYTNLGSGRNCTGGGTTSLTCTVTDQDELVYEDSFVYLGCADDVGNENLSSTSGAVKLIITGLEAAGDTSVGLGVQNALLSGYTNYTSQQVYARHFNGDQDVGTFDWVAKKGSKAWAFNYVTKGEQHVGMFNITPTLYVFEMNNITSANITKYVELVINATK